MVKVNFDFIAELEGKAVLNGYVPDPDKSNSGVTIATGFDLGQRSDSDLAAMLPEHSELVDKLAPYCLLKRNRAVAALTRLPLHITNAEAKAIDNAVKQQLIGLLQQRYNLAAPRLFTELPEEMQTVIASVAFQYGDLASRCPKFWQSAVNGWGLGMINELRNFGDRYPTRRNREANYLNKFYKAGSK